MPLAAAVVPALISGAAAVGGAALASSASKKATNAQTAANNQALAAQQANLDRIQGLNQPFINGGQGAYSALLARYGIQPTGQAPTSPMAAPAGAMDPSRAAGMPGPTASTGPAYGGAPYTAPGTPASGGGADWRSYIEQNPDIAANVAQDGDPTNDIQQAQDHYTSYGKSENRALPMAPMTPAQPGQVVTPDLMNGTRPDVPAAPTFGPRQDVQMGDYGQAPNSASYYSNFEEDPGAAYRRSEALNGVNAASAVRGKLRSGDAAKALATLASNLGSQEYNNWFNRQTTKLAGDRGQFNQDRSFTGNLWNQQQDRADTNYNNDRAYGTSIWDRNTQRTDTNYNADRAYQTGRNDQYDNNLFNLTNVGLNAAGNVAGASTNYANNASSIYGNQGQAAANNAYNQGAATNYGVQGVANAAGNLFASWGGSNGSAPPLGNTVQPWNGQLAKVF